MNMNFKFKSWGMTTLASCVLAACSTTGFKPQTVLNSTTPSNLNFDSQHYTSQSIDVAGQKINVRVYEKIVYVAHPVDPTYEVMNIYIPEAYFHHQKLGKFSAETAPIFLPNQIGGYMPSGPASLNDQGFDAPSTDAKGLAAKQPERQNTIAVALSKGYVVASPGARGRTAATGKAPAAIVDLKAAVRYLHFNDARMPGDANKIISNGTSAGGALSALLGASGNSADYEPYLKALGAAPASDAIYAVSAYCAITNLDHADSGYEWLLGDVHDYQKIDISMLDYKVQRKTVNGALSSDQIQLSELLRAEFPAYLNQLKLHSPQGQPLSLDAKGNGSFKTYLASLVIASAQTALDEGQDLSSYSWLKISNGHVTDLDFNQYLKYLGRGKVTPAFDATDLSAGENQLFGNATVDKQHFTAFGQAHNTVAGATLADHLTIKMMNPMNYIGAPQVMTAKYWRIRQGTKDSDTSLAIPTILATTLQNQGYSVDFALPWNRPHSGDYDLDALFSWMDQISTQP